MRKEKIQWKTMETMENYEKKEENPEINSLR